MTGIGSSLQRIKETCALIHVADHVMPQAPYVLICLATNENICCYSLCADCSSLFSSLETDTVPDSLDAMFNLYRVCSTGVPVTRWYRV